MNVCRSLLACALGIGLTPIVGAQLPTEAEIAITPLDAYLANGDATYSWELVNVTEAGPLKIAVIKLKSQTWRTTSEVSRPVWEHWLVVTVPERLSTDRAFLLIGGGSHDSQQPSGSQLIAATIAQTTGSIVAELSNVPNQPLEFRGDGVARKEDDLIGYAWSQFLETGDATWLPRLPMVKSAVRAMDCITEFAASPEGGHTEIKKFVVGGGSKRGWTTWMTGAADERVEAIVPIVIDVLNAEPSLRHHAEAYGFWAEAIGNYYQHQILQRFDHPRMQELYRIIDPYYYLGRLTESKYIVNGSGDQFFLPDSSQFYFDQLQGEKLMRYVPNADHGLKNSDAIQSIAAYYHLISTGMPRPEYSWQFADDQTIRARTQTKPRQVLYWEAYNPEARDFRLKTIGAAFRSVSLQESEEGLYVSPKPASRPGWTAGFIEFTYDVGCAFPLKVTTAVRVTPDRLPFEGIDLSRAEYEPNISKAKVLSTE
jgi:PhoPQ-activated pathogenicity-related protein